MNNDSKSKQVIVIRKDLKMTPGKLAAQVAHASISTILQMMEMILLDLLMIII